MVKETVKVTRVSLAVVTALSAMVAVGCNDNENNLVPLVATFVTVNAGSNGQTGTAGQQLANPISVHVTDQNSNALAGVSVAWAIVGAGGSVSVASSLTDSNGDATTLWTLGTAVALDSLTASIATGASATITASATAAGATLAKVSGDNQVVEQGAVSLPMVVKVANAGGTGIGAAGVAWSVVGGGTLSATATSTDANGLTSVTLTAPAVAGAAITVTATAASGATQSFTLSTPAVNPQG
jgi:adhesin/invasin